jgi:hypothetical protein
VYTFCGYTAAVFLETFVKMLAIVLGDFMGAKPASYKTIWQKKTQEPKPL